MSKMFKTAELNGLPGALMSLGDQVWHGRHVGINTRTAEDHLCGKCLERDVYSTLFVVDGVWHCAIHDTHSEPHHKSKVAEYKERYNGELQYRLQEETMSDTQRALVKASVSPLVPSRQEKQSLMKTYLEAGIVNREDFGKYADMAAEFLAIVALVHGLNPMLKEVHAWPIKRYDAKDGGWRVVGIETSVGVYGYQRQADERARKGDDYAWGEMEELSREEKLARGAHKCPGCDGSGKAYQDKPCKRCSGKSEFDVDQVVVVRREIYLRRQAQMAKEFNLPIKPVVGYGVYRPGDSIPEGRDAVWRAESRATKDAFKKAYALDFWLPSARDLEYRPEPEAMLADEDAESNGDEPHVIDIEAIVLPEESIFEPAPAEEKPQQELPGLEQLGFGEMLPKSQHGTDLRSNAMSRLADFGYPKGKPQVNLLQALYGESVNWNTITAGQLFNALAYASRAHGQPDDVKAALKEECREKTNGNMFWL